MKTYKTLTSGIRIVEYEESLAPAIAEMWNKSGEGWGGQFNDCVWTAEHVIAQQTTGAYFHIYIAMNGNEAVGYCSLKRYDKDEDTAYVQLLNVRPDYHGKGIGKELVLMCVNETITLGLPRVDIHTWPGNTKAVPLYKKCGFQWEDRTDTTHLSNFVPTVLATELFKGFFEKADWYKDSSRVIEIKPDGKKTDKFEFFEYEWEKDGRRLSVGFEKTGRRIRYVETDDYRIEMTAENHELAFGLGYRCRFSVVNKSGNPLEVAIDAKSDGVISFNGSWAESVINTAEFEGAFHINEISREQDKMRMHPCVLADVYINTRHVEFGLGIEPKFPVEVELAHKRLFAEPGKADDVYINIRNNLACDATVKFWLPENRLSQFERSAYEVRLIKGKHTSLKTRALVKTCGYTALQVLYEIKLDCGECQRDASLATDRVDKTSCKDSVNASRIVQSTQTPVPLTVSGGFVNVMRPLHLINQGLTGSFRFETNSSLGAANGLWRLSLNKQDNTVNFDRLIPSGHGEFSISRLGEPYDDEFNIMEPADVRVTQNGMFTTFEADFESGKFKGVVLTEIYDFDATGILKKRHRVKNKGRKPLNLSIQTELWASVGRRAVLHYNGDFHEVADDMIFGFDSFSYEKIDENWIFDMSLDNPAGLCWPEEYKPVVTWGNVLKFTCPIGELKPNQSFETGLFVYMCGIFRDFHDFRNHVLGVYCERLPFVNNHLEAVANGGNPVLTSDSLTLAVCNNRQKSWEGSISFCSPDNLFAGVLQENLGDELRPETTVTVPVAAGKAGIGFADISLRLAGFEKELRRALLITDDTEIVTKEQNGELTVTNGKISFSAAPDFSDAVYSLKYGENEWLYSRYPALEPYSWWNPFVGGIKSFLERMNNSLVLREEITACFVSETDVLGNTWTGIRADVTIGKFDEYKGMRYSQYYLTLPGVPVMCHFMRLENDTGCYADAELYSMLFISGKEGLEDITAALTAADKTEYCLRFCGDGQEMHYDRLVSFSRDGRNLNAGENPRGGENICSENSCDGENPRGGGKQRPEKLYVFRDSRRDRGENELGYDINIAYCDCSMKGSLPDGSHYTTKPIFCILTEKELTLETLADFSKIEFE